MKGMSILPKPLLTVFTPTYNREKLLTRCYESMKAQTNQNFIWMVVDDGSTDGTSELVKKWISESNGLEIKYLYKENGGLHTAYNKAIENIETELCVCIDSDDFMPNNAVELIIDFWRENGSEKYAGIVGLDFDLNGKVIGDLLPNKEVNLIDLFLGKYKIKNGDRTNVVRTELYKRFAPMKVFPGEKNFNPHYMHLQISQDYDFLVLNENLRFVDYQPNGMTNSMLRQYRSSPNSFAEIRKLYLSFKNTSLWFKLKHTIHLTSSCILANKSLSGIAENPHHIMAIFTFPCGFMLSLFIRYKTK